MIIHRGKSASLITIRPQIGYLLEGDFRKYLVVLYCGSEHSMASAYAYLCRKNPYSMSRHVSEVILNMAERHRGKNL